MGKKDLQNIVYVKRNPAMRRLMLSLPAWVTPNAITLFRAALIVPAAFLLRAEHYWTALGVLGLAFLLDFVDGALAEARGLESVFGAFMDPLADKILVCGTLVAIVDRLPDPFWRIVTLVAVLAALLTMLRVIKLAFPPVRAGAKSIAALPAGKIKFVMQVAATIALVTGLAVTGSPAHVILVGAGGVMLVIAVSLAFISLMSQLLR